MPIDYYDAGNAWSSVNADTHIQAAKNALQAGHGMDPVAHALIALALIQKHAVEEGKWGGNG